MPEVHHPEFLWGLLVIPLLFLLSLWKLQPRKVSIPSLVLWKKIPERNPPLKALQKPKVSLSMILQALAVAAGVLGAADPYLVREQSEPLHVIVVVDTSPAMLVRKDSGRTRMQTAVERLDRFLDGLEPNDRVTVFAHQQIMGSMEMTPSEARAIVARVDAANCPDDLRPTMEAAAGFAQGRRDAILVAASWHDVTAAWKGMESRLIQVGGEGGNMGIVDWAVDEKAGKVRISLGVGSTFGESISIAIHVRADAGTDEGSQTEIFTQKIKPGINWIELESNTFMNAWTIELRLDSPDRFLQDNLLTLVRDERPFRILWTGKNNVFVVKALNAMPNVHVSFSGSERGDEKPDLTIFNGIVPPEGYEGNVVAIDPPNGFWGLTLGREPFDGLADASPHPILQDIPAHKIGIKRGREIHVDGPHEVIMTVQGKPVAVWTERKGSQVLAVAMDMDQGWMETGDGQAWAFPVFWYHVCDRIRRPLGASGEFRSYRVCEPVRIAVPVSFLDRQATMSVGADQSGGISLRPRTKVPVPVSLQLWFVVGCAILIVLAWSVEWRLQRKGL